MRKENWCACLYPQCAQAGVCLNSIFGAGKGRIIDALCSNIRNAALEEAAKMCDDIEARNRKRHPQFQCNEMERPRDCAEAIRALKDKEG